MASATVTRIVQTANPLEEVAVVTATDKETYTSRKFNTIQGATIGLNGASGTAISISFSGTFATIHGDFADEVCTITLVGE